jgi:hypothetical protein
VSPGITKLDKEKNQCIRQKTGAQDIVKEIITSIAPEDGRMNPKHVELK